MKQIDNIDDLIAKYLSGNASPEEALILENWKAESGLNLNQFELSKKAYDAIHHTIDKPVDENLAWNILNTRITNVDEKVIPLYKKPFFFRSAASIIIIISISFLIKWLYQAKETETLEISSLNIIKTDTLPDGSLIVLNKNSELTYIATHKARKVLLKGEAFFNVVHDNEMPFEILINDVIIKDIGTSFNVKAPAGSTEIEVAVESGIVQFYSTSSTGVTLVKGDKAVYSAISKRFQKSVIEPGANITSYKSKSFLFKNTSLKKAISQINNVYNTNIILQDSSLCDMAVSVEFNNESVETIITVLSETLDLEIEKRNGSIFLKSKHTN